MDLGSLLEGGTRTDRVRCGLEFACTMGDWSSRRKSLTLGDIAHAATERDARVRGAKQRAR